MDSTVEILPAAPIKLGVAEELIKIIYLNGQSFH